MALNVVSKINTRLKFLYRKNKFLSPQLRRLLCNALIQPHFDYACSVWYPNFNKKLKTKLQTLQNKCVHFCLQLDNEAHVGITEFKQINWLPVNYRFRQCLAANVFKFFDDKCPLYMKDVFVKPLHFVRSNYFNQIYTFSNWKSLTRAKGLSHLTWK